MKITKKIEAHENSSVKLTITIAKNDVKEKYDEIIANYAKTIQIPGFRKGKVPISVLERKFGDALKSDVTSDILEKAVEEAFEDIEKNDEANRPLPYGRPVMDEIPLLDIEKDLVFALTYDIMPKVTVTGIESVSVKELQVTVGDTELNEELETIRERNAMVLDKKDDEKAVKDDIVTIDYWELDDADKMIDDSKREDFVFTLGTGQNIFKLDDDLIGMKKGDTKVITKSWKDDDDDDKLAGKTKKIGATITALKQRNLPDLDDELAQDVNEKYKTLADLKADITNNLKTALKTRLREIKTNDILEQLVEKNPMELPASMLEAETESRWRMMAQQFKTTPEQLEQMVTSSGQSKADMLQQWVSDCGKMLKSRLIVDNLLKERTITITPEEVEAEYEKIAVGASISVEEVKNHYADAHRKEYLIDDMKEQKLYTELFAQVKMTKGEKKTFADLFKK